MKARLLIQAMVKYLSGLLIVGLLLFLPAGTMHYWNAWLLIGALFIPMLFMGAILLVKSPDLLAKRLKSNETEREQKRVIRLSAMMFIGGMIASALDFRFVWSNMPSWVSLAAAAVLLIAYGLFAEVMRENAYLSRTIEVQEGQCIVDTGLYGIIRHPMYSATLFLFLSIPFVLGSFYAFFIFMLYPFLLGKRILNEEAVLRGSLPGYVAYMEKVRYRVIPFIW